MPVCLGVLSPKVGFLKMPAPSLVFGEYKKQLFAYICEETRLKNECVSVHNCKSWCGRLIYIRLNYQNCPSIKGKVSSSDHAQPQ